MSDEDDRIVRISAEFRVLYVETEFGDGHDYPRTTVIPYEDRTYRVEFTENG